MSIICIDLHTHSTASDGSDRPAEVVRKAATASLAAIALTDHDTLDGLEEAEEAARLHNILFVRGCEISASTAWGEAHLLGLFIPHDRSRTAALEQVLDDMRIKRMERNERMAEKLRTLGLDVSYEAAAELAGGKVVGRPHFAELLCRKGVVKDRKEAFRRYLGEGAMAYEPRELMPAQDVVPLLKEAGAVVSIAHPRLLRASVRELDILLGELKPLGLDALEAYHSEHDAGDVRECVELAAKHGLLLTGGSDYHGLSKPKIALGHGKGGLRVSLHLYEQLQEYRRSQGLEG